MLLPKNGFLFSNKQNSYKGNRLRDSWLTGITRSAVSCNLVTLLTNFAQYKNFVWSVMPEDDKNFWFLAKNLLFRTHHLLNSTSHSMGEANLNKSDEVLTNTNTVSKYIPKRPRICINWNPSFQTQIYLS